MPKTAEERRKEMELLAYKGSMLRGGITKTLRYRVIFPTGTPTPEDLQEAREKVELMEKIREILEGLR